MLRNRATDLKSSTHLARICAGDLRSENLAEEQVESLCGGVPRVATFDQRPPLSTQTVRELRIIEHSRDGSRERPGVVRDKQLALRLGLLIRLAIFEGSSP